jgi:hypothetical protein
MRFRTELTRRVKQARTDLQVGWHLHHGLSFDPITRAAHDFGEIGEACDWIKPVAYHGCTGGRIRGKWRDGLLCSPFFRDQAPATLFRFIAEAFGFDPEREPGPDQWPGEMPSFSTGYVQREIGRAVASAGETPVYAGIGIGIPPATETPVDVAAACLSALEAGAEGLVVSREYSEMVPECLAAVGQAVRKHNSATAL